MIADLNGTLIVTVINDRFKRHADRDGNVNKLIVTVI